VATSDNSRYKRKGFTYQFSLSTFPQGCGESMGEMGCFGPQMSGKFRKLLCLILVLKYCFVEI
jgi:hypothetical protein